MESLLIGARDEKLDIEPISYDLIVEVAFQAVEKWFMLKPKIF